VATSQPFASSIKKANSAHPKNEMEPRVARKGTDEERVMETFSNLFGVSVNP
jgi:hypothetical protein